MTAWSSYQEFLGDEYRMLWVQGWDFESSIKLGHDSKQMDSIFEASAKCSIISVWATGYCIINDSMEIVGVGMGWSWMSKHCHETLSSSERVA